MRELIVTNHEVTKQFIMMLLNLDREVPVKSHVNEEDVEGAVVYSDRQIPPHLVEKTQDFFVLKTENWVDFDTCSEVDLLISEPQLISLKSETIYMPKSLIKDAYMMRLGQDTPTGTDLINQVRKARESIQMPNY